MRKSEEQTTKKRPLRGRGLDKAMNIVLESMRTSGERITTTSVARRLGLGSRTALYFGQRGIQIKEARRAQATFSDPNRSITRTGNDGFRQQDGILRRQLNDLQATLVTVTINAHRMGLDPEHLFVPVSSKRFGNVLTDAESIAREWLAIVGLLVPLDPNVRRLSR